MCKNIVPFLIVVFLFALAACGTHAREIIVQKPPPPGLVIPPKPGPGYTWMYGYWVRRGRHSVWVPGYWQLPDGNRPPRHRR